FRDSQMTTTTIQKRDRILRQTKTRVGNIHYKYPINHAKKACKYLAIPASSVPSEGYSQMLVLQKNAID
ncbi:9364_t:CDS:1, partial [Ambispora gerdemannii]